jgi:hypothetical protein
MTVAERETLEDRVERLEAALVEYMDAVDKLTFSVEGDMRHDFLTAYVGGPGRAPVGEVA